MNTYNRIERYMIEGCLDDELNILYGSFTVSQAEGIQVDASEIIKKCRPGLYERYVKEYCERNSILILVMKEGGSDEVIYLEKNPD